MADLNQDVDGEVDIADFREWFEKSGGDFRSERYMHRIASKGGIHRVDPKFAS
jgi:hypothetical protein